MRRLYLILIFAFARGNQTSSQLSDDIFNGAIELQHYHYSKLLKGHTDFTLDVNRALLALDDKSVVFSPISLTGALAMTLLGSRGQTFDELARIMHYDKDLAINKYSEILHIGLGSLLEKLQCPSYNLSYVNGIFVQKHYKLRAEYVDVARNYYKAEIASVDFIKKPNYTRDVINSWMNNYTKGKIDKLVSDEISPSTQIVLGSALYFQANWESQFDALNTKKAPFYVKPGRSVMVNMMVKSGRYLFNSDDDLKVNMIGIPYKHNEATMYILLPHRSGIEALKALARKLTAEKLSDLIEQSVQQTRKIYIPKMNLTSDVPVKGVFKYLGLNSLFCGLADLSVLAAGENVSLSSNYEVKNVDQVFSEEEYKYKVYLDQALKSVKSKGIDQLRNEPNLPNPELYVSNIHHKVKLEFNEKGSEGAGAAHVSISSRMLYDTFMVNRPFMFFIRQNNPKLFLFWGTIYNV